MKILFLFQIFDHKKSTIYLDLVRECRDRGHEVFLIAGNTDMSLPDGICDVDGMKTVYMKLPDQFGVNPVKKALIQMSIPRRMKQILKTELKDQVFDIIAYPTPPITLAPVLGYIKKHRKDGVNYLMLKDIFPQNAVDLKMFSERSPIYRYYRRMEEKLYEYSDRIGCMSEANMAYLKEHNPKITEGKIEYFPNTVKVHDIGGKKRGQSTGNTPEATGESIPDNGHDRTLSIVFGGNMGRPQDIEGLLGSIKCCGEDPLLKNVHFSFIGDGSESRKIEAFIREEAPENLTYSHALDREAYETLLQDADLGMISLGADFTIPNFPSRLLSYMQIAKPVFAVVDEATDIDTVITEKACCGYACKAGDAKSFMAVLGRILEERDSLEELGLRGRKYLEEHFNTGISVDILEKACTR